jgi:glutathione S-transferase
VKEKLAIRLAFLSKGLGDKRFLLGDDFSVADGYVLYFLRTWQKVAKGELDGALTAYQARVVERPAVRAALDAEGLS